MTCHASVVAVIGIAGVVTAARTASVVAAAWTAGVVAAAGAAGVVAAAGAAGVVTAAGASGVVSAVVVADDRIAEVGNGIAVRVDQEAILIDTFFAVRGAVAVLIGRGPGLVITLILDEVDDAVAIRVDIVDVRVGLPVIYLPVSVDILQPLRPTVASVSSLLGSVVEPGSASAV